MPAPPEGSDPAMLSTGGGCESDVVEGMSIVVAVREDDRGELLTTVGGSVMEVFLPIRNFGSDVFDLDRIAKPQRED
jgi:hypothetical protein